MTTSRSVAEFEGDLELLRQLCVTLQRRAPGVLGKRDAAIVSDALAHARAGANGALRQVRRARESAA